MNRARATEASGSLGAFQRAIVWARNGLWVLFGLGLDRQGAGEGGPLATGTQTWSGPASEGPAAMLGSESGTDTEDGEAAAAATAAYAAAAVAGAAAASAPAAPDGATAAGHEEAASAAMGTNGNGDAESHSVSFTMGGVADVGEGGGAGDSGEAASPKGGEAGDA